MYLLFYRGGYPVFGHRKNQAVHAQLFRGEYFYKGLSVNALQAQDGDALDLIHQLQLADLRRVFSEHISELSHRGGVQVRLLAAIFDMLMTLRCDPHPSGNIPL